MQSDTFLKNVRNQYEQYPYPPRNADDESTRLIKIELDRLDVINFYCFQGKSDFNNARILIAGGGTGDSTIFLAEQLRNSNSEVVYLDISRASMEVVKQRAAKRKLTNIKWVHGSILALPELELSLFDYISCTGVLHHLDDPQQGLNALKSVLKPSGAMGIMLYGTYGRTGVYQMQKLMRLVNQQEDQLADKIKNTHSVIADLPTTNWFQHNQDLINDHKHLGDSGLVDLLLHEQDVSYSIEQVHQLLKNSELNLVEFTNVKMRQAYKPSMYITDKALLAKVEQLDLPQQQHIAELLAGAFKKHEFYVSNNTDSIASFYNPTNIPFFFPESIYTGLGKSIAEAIHANPNTKLPLKHSSGFEFDIQADHLNYLFFKHVDGKNTLADIFEYIRLEANKPQFGNQDLVAHFEPLFEQFKQLDWMLLKAKQ